MTSYLLLSTQMSVLMFRGSKITCLSIFGTFGDNKCTKCNTFIIFLPSYVLTFNKYCMIYHLEINKAI